MIDAVIFDVDGVLVSPSNHYLYLKKALNELNYDITEDEFYSMDGMPSKTKLNWLTKHRGLPLSSHSRILEMKYDMQLTEELDINPNVNEVFRTLKMAGLKIAIVSNAMNVFLDKVISDAGISGYIDFIISAEDQYKPKPSPSMYLHAMAELNVSPHDTVIFEDSIAGRESAFKSGARVKGITNWKTLNLDIALGEIFKNNEVKVPYINDKLNVLIPMAGKGTRFTEQGYTLPKPLIEVHGKPMICNVVDNINCISNFIFLVLEDHINKYGVDVLLKSLYPSCTVIVVPDVTEGAACTALCAAHLIDNDSPLMICNSDQILKWDTPSILHDCENSDKDGVIFCFKDDDPKWSFAALDLNGNVSEVAEKRVISNNATTGLYYWKRGSDFVRAANIMIDKDIRTRGEFYIAPVYNEAINEGKVIGCDFVEEMHGIGTPEDLESYLRYHR